LSQPAIAVLGLGSIGLRHARNLIALECDVYGFDPSEDARGQLDAAGGRSCAARSEALAGAQAAVVATPNAQHLDDLEAALQRGLHVFIEKPLAHTADGVAALLRGADQRGLVVFPAMNQRFHPVVRATRAVLAKGQVGVPLWARFLCASYLPDWRDGRDYRDGCAADPATGGVLFDIVHEFDMANFLLGPATTRAAVARRSGQLEIAAEDCADVVLEHACGVHSSLHLDYVTRPRRRRFEIGCSDGFIEADLGERRLTVRNAIGDPLCETDWAHSSVAEQYRDEVAEFLACMRGEARPSCSADEALQVLGQVLAARTMCGLPTA